MKVIIGMLVSAILLLCGGEAEMQKKPPEQKTESLPGFGENSPDTLPRLPVDYEVQPVGQQVVPGYQFLEINFIDRASRKVVNTFDVVANQPFSFEAYDYIEGLWHGELAYEIPPHLSDVVSKDLRSKTIYNKDYEEIEPLVGLIYLRNWVSAPPYNNTNYTIVVYQIASYGNMVIKQGENLDKGFYMGGHTTIIILNEKGEKISVIENIPEDVLSVGFSITQDGKYLGVVSGLGEDEDSPFIIPEKWHVIDLIQGKVVIEKEEKGSFKSSLFDINPPNIVATGDKLVLNKGQCYEVYDFENKLIYSKCYLKKDQNNYRPKVWLRDEVIEKDYFTELPDKRTQYLSGFQQHPLYFN